MASVPSVCPKRVFYEYVETIELDEHASVDVNIARRFGHDWRDAIVSDWQVCGACGKLRRAKPARLAQSTT